MTDDELAFVLCHELSHTIYGHTLKQTQNKAWLAGVQVMTPCHTTCHRTPLCPCPHHSRSQHTTPSPTDRSPSVFSLCFESQNQLPDSTD